MKNTYEKISKDKLQSMMKNDEFIEFYEVAKNKFTFIDYVGQELYVELEG